MTNTTTAVTVGPDGMTKSVSTLAMVPKSGGITRIGRQAYTVMMLLARGQGVEDEKGVFKAPLNSVIRGYGGSLGSARELKKHLLSMLTHIVELQSPSPTEINDWEAMALLSQVGMKTKNGEQWVHWAYPPALREEILNPLRYAQISRATISRFTLHASLALYEICARYKNNPSNLTSKQHWHWWLPVLTGKPAPEVIKTEFRFFNRDILKPAIDEVNEVSEITVSLREFRLGRTIEFLQFEVHLKKESKITDAIAIDLSKVAKAIDLGIDAEVAESLFIRHGEAVFSKAVTKFEARLALPGAPVLARLAYFKSLLAPKAIDDLIELKPTTTNTKVVKRQDPGLQAQESLRIAEAGKFATVRAEIAELDADAKAKLISELEANFVERKVSLAMMRRLKDGNLESALIVGEIVRFFWKKTRGLDWS